MDTGNCWVFDIKSLKPINVKSDERYTSQLKNHDMPLHNSRRTILQWYFAPSE